jgi:hypothetical protein
MMSEQMKNPQTEVFELTIFNGHAIIHSEGNIILIDTGTPVTINREKTFDFAGKRYDTHTGYMGLNIPGFIELLETEITTLLGMDILRDFNVLFDYKNHEVTFSRDEIDFTGQTAPINVVMGIPVIAVEVAGKPITCFLDSGAKLSYLTSTITNSLPTIGVEEDFYPGIGKFETDCYLIDTALGNEVFSVKYGNLPALLERTLMLTGTKGIIGWDFFNNFKILLDLKNNRIVYAKNYF